MDSANRLARDKLARLTHSAIFAGWLARRCREGARLIRAIFREIGSPAQADRPTERQTTNDEMPKSERVTSQAKRHDAHPARTAGSPWCRPAGLVETSHRERTYDRRRNRQC